MAEDKNITRRNFIGTMTMAGAAAGAAMLACSKSTPNLNLPPMLETAPDGPELLQTLHAAMTAADMHLDFKNLAFRRFPIEENRQATYIRTLIFHRSTLSLAFPVNRPGRNGRVFPGGHGIFWI